MMKYKIMHRDSVIAEANGFEVTEILSFDFNQALIGSWLPEIATYMKETEQNVYCICCKLCREVRKTAYGRCV